MFWAMMIFAAGVASSASAPTSPTPMRLVFAGLVAFGFGNGSLDVMMNVEGAAIEKQFDKTIMPLFHAFFSFGTVIGAAVGFLAVAWGLNVVTHTSFMAAGHPVIAFFSIAERARAARSRWTPVDEADRKSWRERLHVAMSAWREPRTYALGLIILGMAFAEGGANDWLALGVAENHGAGEALGAAALAVFSVA